MSELVQACEFTAAALEIAADGIVAMKLAVITELGIMAAEFVADQAAAVATLGAAEAAEALLIEATKKVVNGLIQTAEQELIGALINEAVGPLEQTVERALAGLAFKGVEAALGTPGDGAGAGGPGQGFRIHPEEMMRHAQLLHGHAEEVQGHGARFAAVASG
ncbi:hypothetical protein ACFQZC_16045 [Streptacidiphilus monticola]